MNIQQLFKPYIVPRKNGQCQVLIPLVELDELCEKIREHVISSLSSSEAIDIFMSRPPPYKMSQKQKDEMLKHLDQAMDMRRIEKEIERLDKAREVGSEIIVGRMKMLERSIQTDLSKVRERIEKLERERSPHARKNC